MNINFMEKTITLTKKESKLAGNPNSDLYKQIIEIKRDLPDYRIIINNSTKRNDSLKGLNYEYMEKYIKSHDNAEENMKEYRFLRGFEVKDGVQKTATYGQIRKWFLKIYPEIEKYQNKVNEIVNKAS